MGAQGPTGGRWATVRPLWEVAWWLVSDLHVGLRTTQHPNSWAQTPKKLKQAFKQVLYTDGRSFATSTRRTWPKCPSTEKGQSRCDRFVWWNITQP